MSPSTDSTPRTVDVLISGTVDPGATGGRVALHPIHLRSPLAAVREVVGYQITQRPRELDVQVMLAAPDPSLPSRLAERIAAVLRVHGVADLPVRVRAVETIARAPGGKLKLVEVLRDPPQVRPASPPHSASAARGRWIPACGIKLM